MKAAAFREYGSPDVVHIEDVEKPVPKENEVLIRVRAASVNPLDWHRVRGKPLVMRIAGGLRRPQSPRLGCDLAGQVEAIGRGVTRFKPGDEVFGGGLDLGACADYSCAAEAAVITKPRNVTFEQAAAAPVAAFTALQGLRDKGRVRAGQRVLINGAAGGVGTFAVQIAKWLGAEATGVCSTRNVELVRSTGADRVIDYTKEDFTQSAQRYDAILDCAGNHSLSALRRVLKREGVCIIATGPDGPWLGPLARFISAFAMSRFGSQKFVPFIANPNAGDLTVIGELMAAGKLTPVIDRCYRLEEVAEAIRYLEQGHARGKVVITVGANG